MDVEQKDKKNIPLWFLLSFIYIGKCTQALYKKMDKHINKGIYPGRNRGNVGEVI